MRAEPSFHLEGLVRPKEENDIADACIACAVESQVNSFKKIEQDPS